MPTAAQRDTAAVGERSAHFLQPAGPGSFELWSTGIAVALLSMLHTGLNGRLAEIVREHYVFPEMAEQIAGRLRGVRLEGMDDEIAGELTARMQSVNNDRHLRVRRATAGVSDGSGDWEAHYAAEAIQNAGGMRSVGRLDSRTGFLEIAPYTSPVHMAEGYVAAAFALLRGVERLVIDVREGRGGTPETVALICGYLLGSRPIHLQDLIDRAGDARQFWTSPAAARLPDEVPICVLTSARTFSGCEELAYNLQAHRRATIVGETTAGGAHPVEAFRLTESLEVTVPVARSVNTVTGTNWEQVGVVPDIGCDASMALERACEHLEM